MNLENKLTTLRKQLGLSQEDLADKLNISRQAVCKWESGQSTPDIDNLKILSQIFNVSVDNLLNNNEDIIYLNERKSKYGKVIALSKPSTNNIDKDFRPSADAAKKLKIRAVAVYGSLVLVILFAVLAIISLFSVNVEGFIAFGILTPIAGISYKVLDKFLFVNVPINGYFVEQAEIQESLLKKKNYSITRLQKDLLQWFFFDEDNKTFGFYFNGKEQFICPIANYVGFSSSYDSKNFIMKFSLNFCDENGKIQGYAYALSCARQYSSTYAKKEEEMFAHWTDIAKMTQEIFEEIKVKLEFEKSKI